MAGALRGDPHPEGAGKPDRLSRVGGRLGAGGIRFSSSPSSPSADGIGTSSPTSTSRVPRSPWPPEVPTKVHKPPQEQIRASVVGVVVDDHVAVNLEERRQQASRW